MINLLFSPCNLPLLHHAISNLCLYLICNCKITNKMFESFIQILLKKKIQGVIGWNIFMFLKSAELPMRAIKFLSECQSHCFTKTWFESQTEASIKQRLGKKALNFSGPKREKKTQIRHDLPPFLSRILCGPLLFVNFPISVCFLELFVCPSHVALH